VKNLLSKLRGSLGLPDDSTAFAETRSIKKEPLSYKRKSFRPSYKMEGKRVIPTKKREYQDEYGLMQEEEKPLLEGVGSPRTETLKKFGRDFNARQRTKYRRND
jgi:hypothetical protein